MLANDLPHKDLVITDDIRSAISVTVFKATCCQHYKGGNQQLPSMKQCKFTCAPVAPGSQVTATLMPVAMQLSLGHVSLHLQQQGIQL